jgi:enamine deaminase RidA (YjgF/YER057c/UK114 family)
MAGMSPYGEDKKLVGQTLQDQTRQAFRNMNAAMESVGGSIKDVCSITIYVQETDLQKNVYPRSIRFVSRCSAINRQRARLSVGSPCRVRPKW